jgi:UDP-N-acetylglucosamine transferase subunit ALG13
VIFLTVGTQLPFDRLVGLVDQVAEKLPDEIFGQIGKSTITPRHFNSAPFLSPQEFHERVVGSRLIVGHAGMGTLLTAAKYRKPVAILARKREFNEHRNDHQLATVEQMKKIPGVYAFQAPEELLAIVTNGDLVSMSADISAARQKLTSSIKDFIER